MNTEANGIRFNCRIDGPDGALWLMLSNSLATNLSMWDRQTAVLSEHYRVLRYDQRGHGESDVPPGNYDFDLLADDAAALMQAHGIDACHFIGLSMGGMTAMRVMERWPDRVKALVLFDTQASAESAANRVKYQLMAVAYRRFGLNPLLERSVKKLMFSPTSLRDRLPLVRRWREDVERHHRHQLSHAIDAVTGRADFDLSRIAHHGIPTLILVGEDDVSTPPVHSRAIAQAMPGSKLVVVPQAGHLSALERPDWVADVVSGFLEAL